MNYTFSKTLATAASYNNQLVDPVNLRNDYNPVPYDRTHVFNAHYTLDFGKRYKGDSALLKQAANGWQVSGIRTWQSGVDLPSGAGGELRVRLRIAAGAAVYTVQQTQVDVDSGRLCIQQNNVAPDKNGNQFCVNKLSPTVWLGTPDYLLMPTLNCNPAGGSKSNQYINPTVLRCAAAGQPHDRTECAVDESRAGRECTGFRISTDRGISNHNLSVLKNFGVGEGRILQLRAEAFNFLNHPLVSFNNNDNTNLNMGNLNFAVAGQPLTASQLRSPNFGIANIKYGSRLIELGAKFTF